MSGCSLHVVRPPPYKKMDTSVSLLDLRPQPEVEPLLHAASLGDIQYALQRDGEIEAYVIGRL